MGGLGLFFLFMWFLMGFGLVGLFIVDAAILAELCCFGKFVADGGWFLLHQYKLQRYHYTCICIRGDLKGF